MAYIKRGASGAEAPSTAKSVNELLYRHDDDYIFDAIGYKTGHVSTQKTASTAPLLRDTADESC